MEKIQTLQTYLEFFLNSANQYLKNQMIQG